MVRPLFSALKVKEHTELHACFADRGHKSKKFIVAKRARNMSAVILLTKSKHSSHRRRHPNLYKERVQVAWLFHMRANRGNSRS
jgi:hypothetical protein